LRPQVAKKGSAFETARVPYRGRVRIGVHFDLGPLEFDFAGFVGLRLNEHVLHTWDIDVSLDPAATLPPDAAHLVIDNLDLIARFTAKSVGEHRSIGVTTTDPARAFRIDVSADAVSFTREEDPGDADVTVPAEAFIRLVYGRLDPEHTPAVEGDLTALDQLREVYPGP
jgi:hypothetical protein